ncbi:recombinase RecT [Candidatus Saccharibacteria bacterium]|nr:recombinase RecT [Candidatus Saccharibacteria bacterium]
MANLSIAQYVRQDAVSKRLNELLGKRAPQFVTSLVSAVNANSLLAGCKPESVLTAALTAASLDLPINQNLGFAYLIPYKNKTGEVCQFQMGYKGFIQLAQRSGYYKTINATDVREGEMTGFDRLSGELSFEWLDGAERSKAKVVGYVAYFQLLNGFEKSLFMTTEELEKHAQKYSKNYAKYKTGLWADNFDSMAKKTVLKLLISKFGPLNTQLEDAIQKDQTADDEYVDNPNKVEVVDAELGESEESQ